MSKTTNKRRLRAANKRRSRAANKRRSHAAKMNAFFKTLGRRPTTEDLFSLSFLCKLKLHER